MSNIQKGDKVRFSKFSYRTKSWTSFTGYVISIKNNIAKIKSGKYIFYKPTWSKLTRVESTD